MATIKHTSSKNSDLTAPEHYLTFQHNEYTGLPLLDENGRPKLREEYLLDTLECGGQSFAMACLLANRKYGKNFSPDDVKTHQYIISFDPRDAADNGLTLEKAQALGLQFCKENFPGHPAIVCAHPDGHNGAGNIHVHIVIGSVRIRTILRQPYMEKPCDWQEGMKHRCTAAMLRHLRVETMENGLPKRNTGRSGAASAASTTPTRRQPLPVSPSGKPNTKPRKQPFAGKSVLFWPRPSVLRNFPLSFYRSMASRFVKAAVGSVTSLPAAPSPSPPASWVTIFPKRTFWLFSLKTPSKRKPPGSTALILTPTASAA